MPLTDTGIRSAKKGLKPRKLSDSGGLYLDVKPNGSKLWRYRYRIDGRENVFAIGEYVRPPNGETELEAIARKAGGQLTLSEARSERDKARALVKQRVHPS